jgi:hypothetical protein
LILKYCISVSHCEALPRAWAHAYELEPRGESKGKFQLRLGINEISVDQTKFVVPLPGCLAWIDNLLILQ